MKKPYHPVTCRAKYPTNCATLFEDCKLKDEYTCDVCFEVLILGCDKVEGCKFTDSMKKLCPPPDSNALETAIGAETYGNNPTWAQYL
eukprot:8519034-Ditylum_brightwellii.AAC.1